MQTNKQTNKPIAMTSRDNSLDTFWQGGSSSLALRYPLTPILEDEYFGECDECDVTECDELYHHDADDEEEEEIVTLTSTKRHLVYKSETLMKDPFEHFEADGSGDLFASLESRDHHHHLLNR